MTLSCPLCGQSDAVRCKDDPRFYRDGRLWARCFHGNSHPNQGPVSFYVETGEVLGRVELTPAESLYQIAQSGPARGFGAAFLAEKCGVYVITKEDLARSSAPVPTEKWMLDWEAQQVPVTIAPLYKGAALAGLEVRAMAEKASPRHGEAAPKTDATRKTVGEAGVYITSTRLQPSTVIVFAGVWDAVSAGWDALQNGSEDRYVFASVPDGFNPAILRDTLDTLFPGVPRLIVSDQDPSGQKARKRFAKIGTLAILPGVGLAKDYRDADPKKRWVALLEGIERALTVPLVSDEAGLALIAHRALAGSIKAKGAGMRDIEAWRFGQRCAGMCKAALGGKKYFAIRAVIYGQTPVAEGLHDYEPILQHRSFRDIQQDYPNLASMVEAGPTESPFSPAWKPPVFIEDGRHWTEIPKDERKEYACSRGWEPWTGQDVGPFQGTDVEDSLDRLRSAFIFTVIPNAPASEVGLRVFIVSMAVALCAMKAEELWHQHLPIGFLPWVWFFGQPGTGKGTASKVVCAMVSGDVNTFGSQRFGGEKEASWLTESVLHLPVVFKDELDQFLDHTALEDLKTYTTGQAIQKRKAYGVDMTLAPKPVVFATNEIKLNSDDIATKERLILVQLDKNPMADDQHRNNALEAFHHWLEAEGKTQLHRVCIHFYRQFRSLPIGKSQYTRSSMFDTALILICQHLHIAPAAVMSPSKENKESAILGGAPWFQALSDHIHYDMNGMAEFTMKAADLWGIRVEDESQKKKLRRYLEAFRVATREQGGHLSILGYQVDIPPFHSTSMNTSIRFRKEAYEEAS